MLYTKLTIHWKTKDTPLVINARTMMREGEQNTRIVDINNTTYLINREEILYTEMMEVKRERE